MMIVILPSGEGDNKVLGVFAKQPIAGLAKTRLAQATSTEWAQRAAQAMLEDSLDRFAAVEAERMIVYAPATATDYFESRSRGRYKLLAQTEGDLGQRMWDFFFHARELRFTYKVVVGSDSPTLPIQYITDAFSALRTHDVVIGPAFDGGFYLIGFKALIPLLKESDIPWGTSRVLEKTIKGFYRNGASLALLPPWYDVDTADDWAMMRGHVLAMRRAGIDPGVPCIEQLIKEQST